MELIFAMETGSNFFTIKILTRSMVILSCFLLISCYPKFSKFYYLDSSSDRIFNFSNDEMEMEMRIDIRSLDKNHHSLTWSNTIRIKVQGKTQDAKISINDISCEMIGKKTKTKGVVNASAFIYLRNYAEELSVDFPLSVQGNETVEFYIPVSFEYTKSIGANHQIVIEINDISANNEKVKIQPVKFSFTKIRL